MAKRRDRLTPTGRKRSRRPPPGSPPGTLRADPDAAAPVIRAIGYGPEAVEEIEAVGPDELARLRGRWPVLWVNVDGLGDVEAIRRIGETFGLHSLSIEDIVHARQRPKVEDYESYLFIVTQMPVEASRPRFEQLSIFLGPDFVLTFQERHGDCFDPVRERLRHSGNRIRQQRADYLAYALLDAVIDHSFPMIELYGERVEALEREVLEDRGHNLAIRIHNAKTDLLTIRRTIWPQRDMLASLMREDTNLVDERTQIYLRDCHDHTMQLIDLLDSYRELVLGLVEIHLSMVGARTNEIMKVLTVIATIFIPMGFVASLYGMNFDTTASPWNMPELHWSLGYPFALGLMFAIAIGLLVYFRSRGWILSQRHQGWSDGDGD